MMVSEAKKSAFVVPHVIRSIFDRLQLLVLAALLLGLVMGFLQPALALVTALASFVVLMAVVALGSYVQYSDRWEAWQAHLTRRR